MSGKNRAFALAIATAALVGFCAPMASAATVQGGPNTGFNGDSILNLSGNQLPINACGNQVPIQGIGAQVPLQNITALLGLGVKAVFTPKDSNLGEIVGRIIAIAGREKS